jgi:hypothetical protein
MASCGYSWVMASRGDGTWVPGNEIGKLEDLPREQGSRIVALARTWYGDPSMTTMAVPKGIKGSFLRVWLAPYYLPNDGKDCARGSATPSSRHARGSAEANIA